MTLSIGDPAPALSGLDVVHNEPFSLSSHEGSVVLLAFSGITWCGPCQLEAQVLQDLWMELQGTTVPAVQFAIVSVSPDYPALENPAKLQEKIQAFGLTLPVVVSPEAYPGYEFNGVPAVFFVDAEGKICATHGGASPPASAVKQAILEELEACGVTLGLNPKDYSFFVAVAQLLFGVSTDGGGVILRGGKPKPVGPWDPLQPARLLGPHARDVLTALAAGELAAGIEDPVLRRALVETAVKSAAASAKKLEQSAPEAISRARTTAPTAPTAIGSRAERGSTRMLGAVSAVKDVSRSGKRA